MVLEKNLICREKKFANTGCLKNNNPITIGNNFVVHKDLKKRYIHTIQKKAQNMVCVTVHFRRLRNQKSAHFEVRGDKNPPLRLTNIYA